MLWPTESALERKTMDMLTLDLQEFAPLDGRHCLEFPKSWQWAHSSTVYSTRQIFMCHLNAILKAFFVFFKTQVSTPKGLYQYSQSYFLYFPPALEMVLPFEINAPKRSCMAALWHNATSGALSKWLETLHLMYHQSFLLSVAQLWSVEMPSLTNIWFKREGGWHTKCALPSGGLFVFMYFVLTIHNLTGGV